jgi:hypothetical protein
MSNIELLADSRAEAINGGFFLRPLVVKKIFNDQTINGGSSVNGAVTYSTVSNGNNSYNVIN